MTRRSLIFAAIALTTLVCTVPAGASQTRVVVQGSVLLPYGHSVPVERTQYKQQGCTQDIRDGRTAALLDVRGFDIVRLQLRAVDVSFIVPPTITGYLYGLNGRCDLADNLILGSCDATPTASCTLFVSNERYVEIAFSTQVGAVPPAGVHFTATLIAT